MGTYHAILVTITPILLVLNAAVLLWQAWVIKKLKERESGSRTQAQIEAQLIEYLPGYNHGQGCPAGWRCNLCDQFGFDGPQSIRHSQECIAPALTARTPQLEDFGFDTKKLLAEQCKETMGKLIAAEKQIKKIEAYTIERCAQVAETRAFSSTKYAENPYQDIAAAIRALKDKPPIDPNIVYPGKDLTNTFPEEDA